MGLTALILIKVLAPGFYARQDVRTPVKIAIMTLIFTQLMNAVFVVPLQHAGLALAISLGACLNAGVLLYCLRKDGIYQPQPGWMAFSVKVIVAVGLMVLALWLVSGPDQWWLESSGRMRVLGLGGLVMLGMSVYFGVLVVLGFRPRDFGRNAD